jgi:phage tail tape-measure protein
MNQRLNIDIVANDKSKQALSELDKNLGKVKSSIFNLKNAFLGIGAGVVIKGFFDAGVQIENLEVQLNALFKSAEKGKQALDIVTKFAAGTPFELKNIQQGITSLATVSKTAEESGVSFEELLKITGNTAVVLGGDFALASLQIQRSFSAGISSAELFRERGVKAMAGFKEFRCFV